MTTTETPKTVPHSPMERFEVSLKASKSCVHRQARRTKEGSGVARLAILDAYGPYGTKISERVCTKEPAGFSVCNGARLQVLKLADQSAEPKRS